MDDYIIIHELLKEKARVERKLEKLEHLNKNGFGAKFMKKAINKIDVEIMAREAENG